MHLDIPHSFAQSTAMKARASRESGFFLLELMFVLVLFAVLGGILASSLSTVFREQGRGLRKQIAVELAATKLEQLATFNPTTLTDADDGTETLSRGELVFTRTVDVTVNADQSRLVAVLVQGQPGSEPITASLSTTFSLWGSE